MRALLGLIPASRAPEENAMAATGATPVATLAVLWYFPSLRAPVAYWMEPPGFLYGSHLDVALPTVHRSLGIGVIRDSNACRVPMESY